MTRSVLITVTSPRDLRPIPWTCTFSLFPPGFIERFGGILGPAAQPVDKGADAAGPERSCLTVVLCLLGPVGARARLRASTRAVRRHWALAAET